jgi:multidrug efflux pump subunit AcrA (membrane-fusion protein)
VNPVVDPVSHVGRTTVRLSNPGARILPGMHARVRIAGRLFEDRVSVPKEAIVERSRREVVFVFEPDSEGSDTGRAKWRYVTTGLENEDAVEIVPSEETDMLEEGEIVLVGGHTTLTHDAMVRIAEPAADPGGTS